MSEPAESLVAARDAFDRHDFGVAVEAFERAADAAPLDGDDWYHWAEAAWWVGDIDRAITTWGHAYDRYVATGDPAGAVMAAMFVACHSFERGDQATGSGWRQRAARLLEDLADDPAHGYPLYFELFEVLGSGDVDGALATAARLRAIGNHHDDRNLTALATLGEGRALLKLGRVDDGMALLDEATLAALSMRLHPVWTGAIYCHVMDACHELGDVGRAAEWTQLAEEWCDGLPTQTLYRGICRVHRAQVLRIQGQWREAEREAARACEDVSHLHLGTVAEGHYEIGEIRRQRGDLDGAAHAYRRAHELGRDPQPGLALLRAAEGNLDTAATSIQAALDAEPHDRLGRARLRVAQVDIALAAGDTATARSAHDELESTAAAFRSSGLAAAATAARGALTLRDGDPGTAASELRAACRRWQELDAPHTAASTRVLLAEAYRRLGDEDAAQLELDAADAVFRRLGAAPGIERVAQLQDEAARPAGLTERELEVLRHVADGCTNREIASLLLISERTVHRHLSNIFTKLGVESRTAAAAQAFRQGITTPPR
ncbi:MAG: LuxR C-terminal-related transcriptional regulator [Acidimicrobiales bacterium]|nr:LuxR C-terminal-related transcriptional regulator [Acidimicrobiales bacterium]